MLTIYSELTIISIIYIIVLDWLQIISKRQENWENNNNFCINDFLRRLKIMDKINGEGIFNEKMKRKKIIIITTAVIVAVIVLVGGLFLKDSIQKNKLLYCQEYVAGEQNMQGNVDTNRFKDKSDQFSIGANAYGYAVFKNPDGALEELRKKFSSGINLIQTEFNLKPLSQHNYEFYGTYGSQVTDGTSEEQSEAAFVSEFMDIYENSFSK